MTWSVERDPLHPWLIATFDGALTRQACARATRRILALATPGVPQGFLVDVRHATNELSVGDIYSIPAMWEHGGVERDSALALVITAESALRHDAEFFENTCRNRGWNVCVFDDYATALAWLDVQVPPAEVVAKG